MLSITKLIKYATLRKEQLEKQEKIDKQLDRMQLYCPNAVANTYRLERRINNKNSSIAYQYSTLYNLGIIDKMLTQINNYYDNVDSISKYDNSKNKIVDENYSIHKQCELLNNFVYSYSTNLNSGILNLDNLYEHNGPVGKPKC